MLDSYLKESDNWPDIFWSALNTVCEIIVHNIYLLPKCVDKDMRFSQPYDNLSVCCSGAISLVNFITSNYEKFPSAKNVQFESYSYLKNDRNIYGAIADGIYRIIESSSMNRSMYESIRLLLITIYPYPHNNIPHVLLSIQERLNILLENKVEENLTNLLYPSVTASLIYAFGLCEPDKAIFPIHKTLLLQLKQKYWRAPRYCS